MIPDMLSPARRRKLASAGRKVRRSIEERDWLVKEAVEAGGSYREVGEAVGMSHTAVKFIAKGRP